MMSRGFRGQKYERTVINPDLRYWAPFVGETSRIGDLLYHSEHRKVNNDKDDLQIKCREMSEEQLLETLFESRAKEKGSKLVIADFFRRTASTCLKKNKQGCEKHCGKFQDTERIYCLVGKADLRGNPDKDHESKNLTSHSLHI